MNKETKTSIRVDKRQIIPFLGLVVIVVFFQIVTKGRLFGSRTFTTLFNEVFNLVIAGCGVMFVMCEGNIDFSIGGTIGITTAIAAVVSQQIGWWCIFPITIIGGALIGLFCATLVAKLRLPAFIATIGVSFMLRGIITIVLDSGPRGCDFGFLKCNNLKLKIIVLLVFVAVMYLLFAYTKYGRQCKAIGANRVMASQSGVNITKMLMIPYIVSGACAGIVAGFNLAKSLTAASTTGDGFQFNVMLALMLGGFTISGGWAVRFKSVVIGACMYAVIVLGLTTWGVTTDLQQLVKGIVFIIAVASSIDRKNVSIVK